MNIGVDVVVFGMVNVVVVFISDVNVGYWNFVGLLKFEDN